EMSVLMLITAAGIKSGLHDMANGANMSFSKNAFNDVNGYEGNHQYASGDDMFLIEKMRAAFPDKIAFVKSGNAIVETPPKQDWNSLIKQRIRWEGKNKGLKSSVIRMIWSFIGFYHLMIFITIVLAVFHLTSWWALFILLPFKWIGDIAILNQATRFFKKRQILYYFIPLQMMYSFYILTLGYFIAIRKKGDW
ncbi:MAG: glycosyltransferase family 2 protein, partial [Saprospiraceae bacterium]